jgi:alpha-L-rhamnosidase
MKKELLLAGWCLLLSTLGATSQVTVQHLQTENLENPIGIDAPTPRFSWQIVSNQRMIKQTAWEIKVQDGKNTVWNSGKVMADQSVQVPYGGSPLQSATQYNWQVRIWDNNGATTPWSSPASFKTALLSPANWKAQWISPGFTEDANRPAILFRKAFAIPKKIRSATAYITSHGMYEAQINGQRVGDAYLTPGWTSYNKRLQYQVYDVTSLLANGQNAIGVSVGNGWYRGNLAWGGNKNIYGSDIALLFQLAITYTDGTSALVVSDESWKSSTGLIRYAEIYHGETIDTRQEKTGWTKAGYNDAAWSGVQPGNYSKEVLIATGNEPVKKHETFKPVKVLTTPNGKTVLDFGQNLVGWVMVKAKGNSGDSIVIRHAEVLDKYGNFYTENLRAAKATATYILDGKEEKTLEPHFTFFGFRYILVENYPGEIKPENFTAVAMYSSMPPTGSFVCSNPMLNQLQHNIQWGQRGNFLDVPTDCPQRDERLGWTGDAQAFSRTAAFNFGVNNFFAKWLHDVAADQTADGLVPHVIPNVLGKNDGASTGWADVSTILPWNMYLAYGDKRILQDQYKSMKAWVNYMQTHSKNDLWQTGFHFGDWLFYRPFDDNDGKAAVTDKYLIAQCFYANSTNLLLKTATLLGNTEDAATYKTLLEKIKAAFVKEYLTPNGRLVSGTQTAYVLALQFDMLPEPLQTQAAARLAENIKSYNNHLTTGFLGTPYLCHVLHRFGYTDIAYKLLLQESYPSWLYPVKMGATTIWERWDGQKPDSTFQTPGMNSFNHYAYGAIGDWMYRVIAGLDTYEDGPGYKHIKIQPHPGGGLTKAAATLQTYYGTVSSSWIINGNELTLDVEIPANTTADVYIPAESANAITEGGKAIAGQKDLPITGTANQYVVVKAGSGKYHFVTAAPAKTN